MSGGMQARKLSLEQIEQLRRIQLAERISIPKLHQKMQAGFDWQTLSRALDGRPIWILNYLFIEKWLQENAQEKVSIQEASR